MTNTEESTLTDAPRLAGADWPVFGWAEDIRPALGAALEAGRPVALATLYRVAGSAPRSPGVQMLFDGDRAVGYFTGGCVEDDVAYHAAEALAKGAARRLHYGAGSPWIDIKLTCGGAIHIFIEPIAADSAPARALLLRAQERAPALWISDGIKARIDKPGPNAPLLALAQDPFAIARRYDPPWRLIVSGWDPTALAIAKLGLDAQFDTVLVRSGGPELAPPIAGLSYRRTDPAEALKTIGVDPWTAFVGATHDSELDIPACAAALNGGAGYVGLVGAASRVAQRKAAIRAAGAAEEALSRLCAPAGATRLGKAPWNIAVGIIAEILEAVSRKTAAPK